MLKHTRWLLILVLISLAGWQLYPHLKDFKTFYRLKDQIDYFWLILALISQTGQYLGDGWLSKTLLKMIGIPMSFVNTVRIASLNVFAAHLLPVGQAGAIATIYYFYKKLGVKDHHYIFLSLSWSSITSFTLFMILTVALVSLPRLPNLPLHVPDAVIVFLAVLTLISIPIVTGRKHLWPRVSNYVKKLSIYKGFIDFGKNISYYRKSILSNKILLVQAFIAAFIYYLTNVATLIFSFLTFGSLPDLSVITVAYALSLIAGLISLAPGGIGATEATMVLIFLQFNVDPTLTIAATLLFRLISFWLPIPAGAISYLSLKRIKTPR